MRYKYQLKVIGGILLTSPIVFTFFKLDHSTLRSLLYTLVMYAIACSFGVMGYNYMETGDPFKATKINKPKIHHT